MAGPDSLGLLAGEREVHITIVRSKTGKRRTIPVWFTTHGRNMELLPMYGLKTKWFIDVQKSGEAELRVKDWSAKARPSVVRDSDEIDRIKQRFSEKYGEREVKMYYPAIEVALLISF